MGQYTIKDIQDQTELLEADVQRIYRSIYKQLGRFPASLDQVPYYIITQLYPSPTKEPLTITPSIEQQEFTTPENIKYDPITIEPVTSAIDGNIIPEHIKTGVTILGVEGILKEEKTEEVFDVQPTTSDQTITPTEGSVFSGGTVHAVTSAIDSNIQPENIKEGVRILGVAGTLSAGGDTPDYRNMKGTVDRAGLKAIGWTDEDILTYEQNAPHYTWQNDQYKVSDENKALYLLDNPDPSSYKDNPNITFVPKKNMESYFAKSSAFRDMKYIKGIPFYDTSKVTDTSYLFASCSSLTTIPSLDTSKVTNASYMFYGCHALTSIPSLDTSKVTNASYMFQNCSRLTTVPSLDTSSVTNASYMFSSCSDLTSIPPIDTSSATDVSYMFYMCRSLTTIPSLDTSKVTNALGMFYYCTGLRDIPPLNMSNATTVESMFESCSSLTTIPSLDTSKATKASNLFNGCSNLTTVEGIDFSGLTSSPSRLFGWDSDKSKLTRFIVNGKINVSLSDNYSIKALTAIDYDSVKSILAAADRTDNTNAKTLAFNRTMTDQNGELAALVASCTSKGWTISGLTLQ